MPIKVHRNKSRKRCRSLSLYPCKTFYHMTCISSSMPLKANGCHNHLKLKIKASSAIFCFFRRYFT